MSIIFNGPLTLIRDQPSSWPYFSLPTTSLPSLKVRMGGDIPGIQEPSPNLRVIGILTPNQGLSEMATQPLGLHVTSWAPTAVKPSADESLLTIHGTIHRKMKEAQAILMSVGDGALQVR